MKDVMITIKSVQSLDGAESDGAELITQGSYDYDEQAVRISYMESELTGLEGTKTAFLITPDEVVLSRRGAVNAQMRFQRGKRCDFKYNTAYGVLSMGLDTRKMEWNMDEHGGDMEIEYDINFDKSFLSHNIFKINVREKELKS